jgi:hypothetical protein
MAFSLGAELNGVEGSGLQYPRELVRQNPSLQGPSGMPAPPPCRFGGLIRLLTSALIASQ